MSNEKKIIDDIFDAIEQGTALNITTDRTTYTDSAVLVANDDLVTISTFDVAKDREREIDLGWNEIVSIEPY